MDFVKSTSSRQREREANDMAVDAAEEERVPTVVELPSFSRWLQDLQVAAFEAPRNHKCTSPVFAESTRVSLPLRSTTIQFLVSQVRQLASFTHSATGRKLCSVYFEQKGNATSLPPHQTTHFCDDDPDDYESADEP